MSVVPVLTPIYTVSCILGMYYSHLIIVLEYCYCSMLKIVYGGYPTNQVLNKCGAALESPCMLEWLKLMTPCTSVCGKVSPVPLPTYNTGFVTSTLKP